jgi:hypothetical protein
MFGKRRVKIKKGQFAPFALVEMAGIEPASRTLLKSATTLIFGY